jgi:hypothetical protein
MASRSERYRPIDGSGGRRIVHHRCRGSPRGGHRSHAWCSTGGSEVASGFTAPGKQTYELPEVRSQRPPVTLDLLELDGVDYRPLLLERKARLSRLVDRRLAATSPWWTTPVPTELVFEHACKTGLEGILLKRLLKPYQSGRSGH